MQAVPYGYRLVPNTCKWCGIHLKDERPSRAALGFPDAQPTKRLQRLRSKKIDRAKTK